MKADFESNTGGPKMVFDGIAYTFENKQNGGWKTKKLEMRNKTVSGTENIRKYFPKRKTVIFFYPFQDLNDYWNFLDKDGTKVAEGGKSNWRYYLEWNRKFNGDRMQTWSSNPGTWRPYFFDGSKLDLSIQALGEIAGEWQFRKV